MKNEKSTHNEKKVEGTHHFCICLGRQVTPEECRETTMNKGTHREWCWKSNCKSAERLCMACVVHDEVDETSSDISDRGLCLEFHERHGYSVSKYSENVLKREISTQKRRARHRVELRRNRRIGSNSFADESISDDVIGLEDSDFELEFDADDEAVSPSITDI